MMIGCDHGAVLKADLSGALTSMHFQHDADASESIVNEAALASVKVHHKSVNFKAWKKTCKTQSHLKEHTKTKRSLQAEKTMEMGMATQ